MTPMMSALEAQLSALEAFLLGVAEDTDMDENGVRACRLDPFPVRVRDDLAVAMRASGSSVLISALARCESARDDPDYARALVRNVAYMKIGDRYENACAFIVSYVSRGCVFDTVTKFLDRPYFGYPSVFWSVFLGAPMMRVVDRNVVTDVCNALFARAPSRTQRELTTRLFALPATPATDEVIVRRLLAVDDKALLALFLDARYNTTRSLAGVLASAIATLSAPLSCMELVVERMRAR